MCKLTSIMGDKGQWNECDWKKNPAEKNFFKKKEKFGLVKYS